MVELARLNKPDPNQVISIEVEVFQLAYDFAGGGLYGVDKTIRTKEQADHSLPYLLAVALLDGGVIGRAAAGDRGPGARYLVGRRVSYCDLSLFQLIAGLRYALPRAMVRLEPGFKRVTAVHDRIAARPRIAAYLQSARRIPFNEQGIFRHYPELDATI
jgi:hypothetical protein